jgi:site-specific DNA recombinase
MTAARAAASRWTGPTRIATVVPIRQRKCQRLISYARLSVKKRNGRWVVSDDPSERIEAQLDHNAARAAADGHTIVYTLVDDGLSAYDPDVYRDGFETALKLLASGEADGFLAWNADRMCRQVEDAARIIRVGQTALVPVLEGTGGKVWDFTDSGDAFMFTVEAASNRKSSADTQRRVNDKLAKNREAGKVNGRSAFGYMRDPEDPSFRIVNPVEAEVIREVAGRVLAGELWKSILDDLVARGIKTPGRGPTGGYFTRQTLRGALLAPRMAGLLVHHDEIVGPIKGRDGKPVEPILDYETWTRLCSEIRGRTIGAPRADRSLLSGIAKCGQCGNLMSHIGTLSKTRKATVYKCRGDDVVKRDGSRSPSCNLAITTAPAEEVVREAVLRWLSNPKRLAKLTAANAVVDAKAGKIQGQLDRLMEVSKRNARKLADGIWDQDTYDELDGPNDARIVDLKAELRAMTKPSVLRDLAKESLMTGWDDATTEERRAMVQLALKSVTILPAQREAGASGGWADPRARVVCVAR